MMKKKNASEVGRICKIDRKAEKNFFIYCEKWLNLKNFGAPLSARRALCAEFKPVDDEVVNFINYVRSQRLLVTKVTYRRVHDMQQSILIIQNSRPLTARYKTFYVYLVLSVHSSFMEKVERQWLLGQQKESLRSKINWPITRTETYTVSMNLDFSTEWDRADLTWNTMKT